MSEDLDGGVRWLVEERDRLRARLAILENELVRRDGATPKTGAFKIQLDELEVHQMMVVGAATAAGVADVLATRLASEIVKRCLHKIIRSPEGNLLLIFDGHHVDGQLA